MRRRAVAAVALLALAGCTGDAEEPPAEPRASALVPCPDQPGTAARGAELMPAVTLDCPTGGTLDLGRAPGVPTLVNLWATWCPPCRAELPLLQEFAEDAGDRVRVIGVISKDGQPQAESLAEEIGIGFPSAFDGSGELMGELGLNVLPFTYFLDADGGLVHTEVGEVSSVDELRGLVAEHLGVQL
ncbi:TlpA family protein disulfide reductase [Blastococcus goldschmidtiae]|uniref:TlpA disulfide reductase family protein n=1 Tax=Blastococcus goldschmidtiae TaxID=3075546 RepID=A0ABU2KBB8_9ACTN|nr:TlpA disulfide reductase family protein [Blastococcus sp. DSM 46792]MDT0277480.1 TlpA disulfide reductase family protein [Blastococcus sp. DSM 46792]